MVYITVQAIYKEEYTNQTKALEAPRLKLDDTHPYTLESWKNLINLYEAWNKPEKAEEWRAKLTQIEGFEEWKSDRTIEKSLLARAQIHLD